MKKSILVSLFFIFYVFFIGPMISNAGIAAVFADLILENLKMDVSYNLRTIKNCPFIIQNRSDYAADALIEVTVPRPDKLKPGYEAIPDKDWIKVIPNKFRLGPGEKGVADVIIMVPYDEKLVGKHFQAHFLCTGSPVGISGPLVIATGAETRIRFSVASKGPAELIKEKKNRVMYSLNFEFDPVNVRVKDPIELGKKIDIRKEKDAKLNLVNKAEAPIKLKLKAVPYRQTFFGLTEGHETGDPEWLVIKPKKLKLKGETIERVQLYLKIPDEEKYKNKKYVFFIEAQIINHVPVEIFSRLFVTTEE
ncbi:MAG: hypothetical protein JW983_06795 [Elusimicrobia bacterium]|nr:hypothetical protein [Elusimicrobiota bacterium]